MFFLNSLKLDISFIVPANTPRRIDLVVKTPEEFLRFLHFFCNRLTSGLFIIIFSSSFLLPVVQTDFNFELTWQKQKARIHQKENKSN